MSGQLLLGRADNLRARLWAAAPKIGAAVVLAVKLVLLLYVLLGLTLTVAAAFGGAIAQESVFVRLAHGRPVNLAAVTALRGACVVFVVGAVFAMRWCCMKLAALLRPFARAVNLLAAVATAPLAAFMAWLVLSSLELYPADDRTGVALSAVCFPLGAAWWVWSAWRKLRCPVAV